MKKLSLALSLLLFITCTAQQKQDIVNYIDRYKQAAIDEMVRSKVPASITLAQGILESGAGTSVLSRNSNNHFGIKCKDEWTGPKYYHDDDKPQECFRVYASVNESYADHSDFLLTRSRYAPLFQLPLTSYKYWAYGLKEAGYATNPKYASMLIAYIEEYELFDYDQVGLALIEDRKKLMDKEPVSEPVIAKASSKVIVSEVNTKEHHNKLKTEQAATVTEVKTPETARPEYIVNGARAIKAEGNEDPFRVAFEYNIDYAYVMLFNDMNTGDRFKDGQYIYLQGKKVRGAEPTYTAQAGETMHDISQKTGIKLRELYLKNAMKMNEQVYAGEQISLQEKKNIPPRTMSYPEFLKSQNKTTTAQSQPNAPVNPVIATEKEVPDAPRQGTIGNPAAAYQVQKTDTLYSIAKKFNTSVEQLKEINNLESTELKTGQTLVIAE